MGLIKPGAVITAKTVANIRKEARHLRIPHSVIADEVKVFQEEAEQPRAGLENWFRKHWNTEDATLIEGLRTSVSRERVSR